MSNANANAPAQVPHASSSRRSRSMPSRLSPSEARGHHLQPALPEDLNSYPPESIQVRNTFIHIAEPQASGSHDVEQSLRSRSQLVEIPPVLEGQASERTNPIQREGTAWSWFVPAESTESQSSRAERSEAWFIPMETTETAPSPVRGRARPFWNRGPRYVAPPRHQRMLLAEDLSRLRSEVPGPHGYPQTSSSVATQRRIRNGPMAPAQFRHLGLNWRQLMAEYSESYREMPPSPFISQSPIMTMERLRNITAERLLQMRRMQEVPEVPAEGLSETQLAKIRDMWQATPAQREHFDVCAICLDGQATVGSRDLIALPCQHIFCADCVCRWLARQPLCVLCKDDVRSKLPDNESEVPVEL